MLIEIVMQVLREPHLLRTMYEGCCGGVMSSYPGLSWGLCWYTSYSYQYCKEGLGSPMACSIYGHTKEVDVYTLFDCPLAIQIYDRCSPDENL